MWTKLSIKPGFGCHQGSGFFWSRNSGIQPQWQIYPSEIYRNIGFLDMPGLSYLNLSHCLPFVPCPFSDDRPGVVPATNYNLGCYSVRYSLYYRSRYIPTYLINIRSLSSFTWSKYNVDIIGCLNWNNDTIELAQYNMSIYRQSWPLMRPMGNMCSYSHWHYLKCNL